MPSSRDRLLAKLLRMAADQFTNHGCNDFDLAAIMPDVEERRALMKEYEIWNNSPDRYDPNDRYEIGSDWALMAFLADKYDPRPAKRAK